MKADADVELQVLGAELALPVLLAPVGSSRLFWPLGEAVAARAAGDAGTAYTLSTLSGTRLEEVRAATRGPCWYQVYQCGGRDVALAAIARARAAAWEWVPRLGDALDATDGMDALRASLAHLRATGDDGVDALACGMYKWLQAPHGTAFMYVRRDRLGELDPNYIGWHGVRDNVIGRLSRNQDLFGTPFNIEEAVPAPDATRFEGGSWGILSVVGARAALEYALRHDHHERFRQVLKVTERLIEGLKKKGRRILSPLQSDRRSGIVVFEDPDPAATYNKLKSLKITVASRVKSLRASPHYYNTVEEIDKLLTAL